MTSYEKLFVDNKSWANQKVAEDPEFFIRLLNIQKPEFLWIGCSDSRVPANEITGTTAGEIFVHRNIANLVVHTDLNILSVLKYAVEVLEIKHIIVCGHYGCGGVNAALTNQDFGFLNKWLRNIKDVYRFRQDELRHILDPEQRINKMVELNVIEQVFNLSKTSIIQNQWQKEKRPQLHGWVYDVKDGIIKDLDVNFKGTNDLHSVFHLD